jgi:GNAT superfamily N-acetyltransferase
LSDLVFREVSPENWCDFADLFESRGGPKSCWCMVWRPMPGGTKPDGANRRAAMQARVEARVPVGILGYRDGVPIAWCSIAPRDTYRHLGGLDDEHEAPGQVWALACFFISRRHRGRGISKKLLRAAIDHAGRNGATVVEAYPVDPDSPSYRFMGFVETFSEAGFRQVGEAGKRRHVMRLSLGRAGPSLP